MSKKNRTPIEVATNQLRSAPWNPRPEISPESVADLAASIKELGLIQRIVVIKDPDKKPVRGVEFYMIVAGHRRFAAWNAANIGGKIPCELIECTIEEAKRMTMIENLQRKDVDPIMEANLVEGLVQGGMTIEAIAAETGRGEKWVWRRKQLSKLTSGWRKLMGKIKGKFTVDCLEKIARYDAKVQDAVFEEAKDDWSIQQEPKIEWSDIRHYFTTRSMELGEARFCTKDCEHCAYNTATTPMLFDDPTDKKGKVLGKCTDKSCFEKKRKEWFEGEKAKLEKKYGKLATCEAAYSIATDYSGKKSKVFTIPVIEKNKYSGDRIVWIKSFKDKTSGEKTKEEEKEAKKAKRDLKKAQKALSEYFAPTDDPITGITKEARETIDTVVFGITPGENFSRSMSIDQSVLWKILCLSNVFGMDFWDDSASLGEFSDKLLQEDVGIVEVEEYEAWRKSLCERLSEVSTDAYNCDYKMVMKYFGDYVKDDLPPGTLDALDEKDPEKADGDGSEADDSEILKEAEDL